MRFTKIKYNAEGVHLEWSTPAEGGKSGERVHHTLVSKNEPTKDFTDALAALRTEVGDIIQVHDEWAEGLRVTGVSINHEEVGANRGFVVTALKDLPTTNAPMVINTPHMREDNGEEQGGKLAPASLVELVDDVVRQAQAYVGGARAQLSLDLESAGEPAVVGSIPAAAPHPGGGE